MPLYFAFFEVGKLLAEKQILGDQGGAAGHEKTKEGEQSRLYIGTVPGIGELNWRFGMPAARTIYRIRLWLEDIHPTIWRRLEVPSDITLPKLHRVIQMAFGWEDCHLHEFRVGVGTEFEYLYDFGDSWNHRLMLETIAMPETGVHYPLCAGGARSSPPEDPGGPHGYTNYVDALADPNHERYDEILGWRGPFDPEAFDVDEINRHLQKDFGPKVRRRFAE